MMAVSKIKELLGLMQKNLECSICLELMKKPVATKCEHFFCRFCITEFLETKRSVPCPLCKQPITKRSLTEKAELGCIVDGVDNLISAFQEDSGTVYSPPNGPQSFFPCTPETISTKPDNQKTKGRKNVRNSRRQSNVALEEETSDSTRQDTDDIFAIPSISCQPPRSSRRKRSTAASVTTASDETPELKSDASTSYKERSRSPATTTADDDNGLLQYLDEGSCGFEREKSEQGTFPVDQNTDVIEPPEKSPCKKARSNQESGDQPEIVIFDENKDDVAESSSNLERNDTQDVSKLNEKNLRSRPLNDIENVIEAGKARPRQKGKDEKPSSGVPENSQNSSNASISSTQQLLQLPVVTKTYGRRSGNKNDPDAKVQDWITALPQNHASKKNTDVWNQKSKQRQSENASGKVLEVESDRVEKKNSSAQVLTATIDADAFCGDDDEDVMGVEDPAQKSKKGHTANLSLQEPEEEIMLTPPIRKKRIFKRKDVEIDENPLKVHQENSPTADPYLFIAGNTPVAKSKKRGRTRSKEKKGNPPQFTLDKGVKKTVRFSEVTLTEPREASFIQHSKADEKGTSNAEVFRTADKPTTSEDAQVTEGPIEPPHLETDSLFETVGDTSADVQFVCPKTTTRSRSKQTKQQKKKESSGEDSQAEEKKKPRKKSSRKVETPEAQKAREEQTRDLASLIGQAEDHDLLFSTQDAHASMDDTEEYAETSGQSFAENAENNKVIAVNVDEDDSNDGFCLMGPLPEERPARMPSSQQSREFDAIATERTAVADQTGNDKTAGTEKTQKKPPKEKKTELPGKNKMASSSDQTVVAETQQSSLQSPASCNVVLPSPLPGSTLPKFSTPKLQNARQTRSAGRGSTEGDFNTGADRFKHFAKIVDVTPVEANHSKRDIEMGASPNVYQKSPEASKRSSDRLRRHKGGSATNSPLVTTVPSTFTEERCSGSAQSPHTKALEEAGSKGRAFDVDHYTLTCVPDTAEKDSHPRPIRSPLHGLSSMLFKSPAATASPAPITSSATRNSPRSSKILSTQTQHTEGNLREGEEDSVVFAGNKSELAEAVDNVSVSKGASTGDDYSKVKDVTAAQVKSRGTDADLIKTNVEGHSDPEADSFSSSTDDLEIMPSENEFEEPDLSLQPEEIQQRISAASSTEDSLLQSSSGNGDKAEIIKQSPSTRSNALRNNTRARDSPQTSKGADGSKKTKMPTGEEQSELKPRHQLSQTEGKTVSPLDSALTHVPESMDVETAGSVTQTPPTNFSAKNSASQISDNDKFPKEGTSSTSTDSVQKQASNLNKVRQQRAPREKDAVSQDSAALVDKSPRCSTKQKLASQLSSDTTGTPSQSILKPISVVAKSVPPSNIHYSDIEKEEDQEPFVAEEDAEVNHQEMESAHKKASSQSHLNPLQVQVADEDQMLKDHTLPEDQTLPESQTLPEDQTLTEGQTLAKSQTLPEDQTLTEGQTLAESQTLEASVDSSASPQQNSPAEMSKLTKACEENENNSSDSNQEHSEEDELKKSEPLVVETQYPNTLEEQSVSLLSPKVIADSIPVDREEEQSPGRSGKDVHAGTESQEIITHADRSRSFQRSMQKSDGSGTTDLHKHSLIPGFSQPELEQPSPQSGEEVSTFVQGKGAKRLQKDEERSSSPATFSITRKRNGHGQESSIKAKLGKDPADNFHTPDLLPLQSPSSSSDKVVNSAPPRTTTIPLDSDDDGAVLIVRRTKRKCFSLDGSPLRPEAPLSTKRRRYATRQKNLADKFDDLAGNGLCEAKDYEEGGGNKAEEKIQPAQPNILQDGQESRQKLSADKNRPMHVESLMSPSSATENREEGVKGNTAEGDHKTDSDPKMTAPSRRRKAVRGLARLSDSSSAEFLPNTRQTRTETASRQTLTSGQTDTSSAEGRHNMTSPTQNSPRILVTLTEAHAEDPMEVEEIDGEMVDLEDEVARSNGEMVDLVDEDARANSLSHGEKKVSTEHCEPNETTEQCFEAPKAAATKATEGADRNPIVIDQMSIRSQTQKCVNQSSVPPSAEDATIPPPDFDLRFDDEDDDSNHGVEDDDSNKNDDEDDEGTITEQERLVSKINISQSKEPEHGDQGSTMDVDPSPSEDKENDIDTPAEEGASDQTSIVPGHEGPETQTSETTVRKARQSPAEAWNKRQGSADALQDSEEEEEEVVVVKKKGRRAVIDSDSDSDHNSGAESEASFQLNFTSSSALSSQSEVPTTQERSKMESELDRLRREIAEMEAKLQGQGRSSSSKSESAGDSCDMNSSLHRRKGGGKSRLTVEDSSDDEVEELSDSPVRSSRKKPKSAGKEQKDSQTKLSRRRRRISSDEEDEEEQEEKKLKVKQPRQQLMDAYVCEVNDAEGDGDDDGVDGRSSAGQGKGHQFSLHTPDKKVKGRADPEVSDEDSSDLFLSPLSPSPPPPTKHSLARKDSYGPPRSLFSVDSPSLSSSVTRIRPSLDFERRGPLPSEKTPVTSDAEWTKYDDIQDSQESEADVSGSLKNIPESQFTASGGDSANKKSKKVKCSGEAGAAALVSESNQNCGTRVVEPCAVDSSATLLPSLCNAEGDEENKENMDVDENCDRMEDEEEEEENDDAVPRWKRKRLGFISSGLDPEKSSVLRKLAEMNECKVYSKFNDSVTHVIMRTNPDSRVCERTLKYFQGIAGQCWVLSFDWVLHCMKAGHFVPEKHYEIHGDTIKGENHCGPSLSRMSTSPLLQGFALASVGASPDMSKKELTQLLTLMGAEVVEDPWDLASHHAKHKLVLRCVDSDTQPPTPAEIELFNGQYKHFSLVTVAREWILDSICTNHLLPLHDYIFNTCKDLRLPF